MYRTAAVPALALALLLLVAAPAAASGAPAHRDLRATLDELIGRQLAEDRIPGAVVSVVAGGRTVLEKGYGTGGAAIDPQRTTFPAASEAKIVTAIAAAQLVAAGRVDPDADVNRYLRDVRIDDTFPGRPVTLTHLLTHTAGFDRDYVALNSPDGTHPGAVAPLGASLAEKQPVRVRPPGEVMAYDSYGFALAGHLVESVSGEPFDRYAERHVLAPLGMTGTSFAQPTPPRQARGLVAGHRPDGDGYTATRGHHGPWTPTGAGTVTSAADMNRLARALLDRDPRLGHGVAELVTRRHFTPDPRVPGVAWALVESLHGTDRVLSKDGDLPGFHHDLALVPERGIAVFVGYDGDGTGGAAFADAKAVRTAVLDHLLGRAPAGSPTPVAGDVGRWAGDYRASTTSEYSLMRVTALTAPVTVTADGDGVLSTSGVSADPDRATQRWAHLGGGEFAEIGGSERLVFDGRGVMTAGASAPEATAYLPLPAWASPALHTALLAAGAVLFVIGFAVIPAAALVRRRRGVRRRTGPHRAFLVVAWLDCLVGVLFLTGFAVLAADPNAMSETVLVGSWLLTLVPYLGSGLLVTTPAAALLLLAGLARGWWGRWAGAGHVLRAVGAAVFLVLLAYYDLVAFGDLVSPGGYHAS